MLTDYVSTPFALGRHRSTPLGGYLDGFTEWLAGQDYKTETIRVRIQSVTAFGVWLHDDVAPQALNEEVLDRYGLYLRRIGRLKHTSGRYFSFASGPRLFLKYLRAIAVAAPVRVEMSPLVVEPSGGAYTAVPSPRQWRTTPGTRKLWWMRSAIHAT